VTFFRFLKVTAMDDLRMNDVIDKQRLARTLMTLYVSWREACLRVDDAYAMWGHTGGAAAADAFERYAAALDQEQVAAERFAKLVRHAHTLTRESHDAVVDSRGVSEAGELAAARSASTR
jgi:hypothetical protein